MSKLLIKGGKVVNVNNLSSSYKDVLVDEKGYIIEIREDIPVKEEYVVIDATEMLVSPGFVDIHVHFREPGYEYKEDLQSGMISAVAGGFTTVACMPNTKPTISTKETVEYINNKVKSLDMIDVKVIGSITKDLEGNDLADIKKMKECDIVAISDDGKTPMNVSVLENALKLAKNNNLLVISHCEDHDISKDGHINQGEASGRTGIKGIPSSAEYNIVNRDIKLSNKYGNRIHIAHVSTKESVEIIKQFKQKGSHVTCEVAPHHFILDDSIVTKECTLSKVNPPLRNKEDVDKIIQAIREGVIDIIATDHAPHDEKSKALPYEKAAFGITGLETSFALCYTYLVNEKIISLEKLIYMMTKKPLEILGIVNNGISVGEKADITIIDLKEKYNIDSTKFYSKGKNTPFNNFNVQGRIISTIKQGKILYSHEGGF